MTIETVDAEVKVNRALTESRGSWDPAERSSHKWTAEGIEQSNMLVFYDVKAYVSCTEYVSTRWEHIYYVNQGGTAEYE